MLNVFSPFPHSLSVASACVFCLKASHLTGRWVVASFHVDMAHIQNNMLHLSFSQWKGFSLPDRKSVPLRQCHPWHRSLLPNTVSLVSPGAERLCKLKPFGLIDQIFPTNASGESWIETIVQFIKQNISRHFCSGC